jgi:hypothetical protein
VVFVELFEVTFSIERSKFRVQGSGLVLQLEHVSSTRIREL